MQVFRSKIDWWLWGVSIVTTGLLLQFLWTMYIEGTMQQYPEHALLYVLTMALLWWPILNTRYIVTEQHLVIHSMLFKWQINRSDITKISESHNLISSPTLSLDRLRIDYQKNGVASHILISSKDKDVFCKLLQQGQDNA